MTQPTAEQIEVTQEVKDQHAIAMGDIDKNFGILSAATSGTARLILAHMLGQTAAIQATEARMAAAVEAERERLIGQVSVDIEIALNKAGVLLTEAQGYIAAEAAIDAIRSQSNG